MPYIFLTDKDKRELEGKIGAKADKAELEKLNSSFNDLARQNVNNLVIQKIKTSGMWVAPKALNQRFKVFVVGGGGGGGNGGGGGGHIVIKDDIILKEGAKIDIVCGAGGIGANLNSWQPGTNGGTTSFGDISAAGGEAGGLNDRNATPIRHGSGGSGGSGGGGAGTVSVRSQALTGAEIAGDGGNASFGGGGGAGHSKNYNYSNDAQLVDVAAYSGAGGSAGTHGGKGGSFAETLDPKCTQANVSLVDLLLNAENLMPLNISSEAADRCGGASVYGGNGGLSYSGISTTIDIKFSAGGGGGFASDGGDGYAGGGGGGGFCGRGGRGAAGGVYYNKVYSFGGGGGGGFFCQGGDACSYSDDDYTISPGGGGGGFFDDGGSLTTSGSYPGTNGGKGGNGGVLIMYIKEE